MAIALHSNEPELFDTTINPKDNQSISFIHRDADYVPSRNPSHFLIGRPLQTADASHQTIGKAVGLAVFLSDAMSSVAYGPQEMLTILVVAGTQALGCAFPLAIGIVALLVILWHFRILDRVYVGRVA